MEQKIPGISKFPGKRKTSRDCPKFSFENCRSIRFCTGISGNFAPGWMDHALCLHSYANLVSSVIWYARVRSCTNYLRSVHWSGRLVAKRCERYKRYERYKRCERSLLNVTNDANVPCWTLQTMRTLENERYERCKRTLRTLQINDRNADQTLLSSWGKKLPM